MGLSTVHNLDVYVICDGAYSASEHSIRRFLETRGEFSVEFEYLTDIKNGSTDMRVGKAEVKKQWEQSKDRIIKDLQHFKPRLVLICGTPSCEFLFNEEVKNLKLQPTEIEIGADKYWAMPSRSLNKLFKDGSSNNTYYIDLLNRIKFALSGAKFQTETPHKIIESTQEFLSVIDMCKEMRTFCFDFETTGVEWFNSDQYATILSISFQHGFSYILPLYHFDSKFSGSEIKYFFQVLNDEIFSNRKVNKIAHNLQFDLHWMNRYGVTDYDGRFNDTMLMSHILDENSKHGLKDISRRYFIRFTGYDHEVKKDAWDKVPLDVLSKYAALDTDLTLRLYHLFEMLLLLDNGVEQDKLHKIKTKIASKPGNYRGTEFEQLTNLEYWRWLETKPNRLYELYRNLVIPSLFALFNAETFGAKIDKELLKKSIIDAESARDNKFNELMSLPAIKSFETKKREKVHKDEIKKLQEKINKRLEKFKAGTKIELAYKDKIRAIKSGEVIMYEGINFSSPSQLKEFLFTDIGLSLPGQLDRKGKRVFTTKREYLMELASKHKFVVLLLAYRTITSMLSTYYIGILDRLDKDHKIHSSFLLHGTTSGRISSRNPNLQNIPARIKFNDKDAERVLKNVKKFFIPLSSKYYMVQVDYSQAELRVIANFSGDKKMLDTYKNNLDIHTITACNELNLTLEQFNKLDQDEIKKHRTAAKGTNFGLVYDMSIGGYMEYAKNNYGIDMSYDEAKKKYDAFFNTYSSIKKWHNDYIDLASELGYVRTLFGRKRRLFNMYSRDSFLRGIDNRSAINSPIQGTSGEFTLFSAAILRHRLPSDCIFFNTVHDSMFFYVPKNKYNAYIKIIKLACERPPIKEYFNIWSGDVPMKTDIEMSDTSWGDMQEEKKFMA